MTYIGEEMVDFTMQKEINCRNCTAGTDDWSPMKRTGGSSSGGLSYHPDVISFGISYKCVRCLEEVHCDFAFGIERVTLAVKGSRKLDPKQPQ
jgi:DNA-directed RNA polymerase subunit RPC12/RpoP